jgi:TPR repeat protein
MRTLRRQAEFGDNDAALVLGLAHEVGQGVPQSCKDAAHWILKAAEDGNSAAQYNMALRYLSGDGVSADQNESKKWLEKAASQGYSKAQIALQRSTF